MTEKDLKKMLKEMDEDWNDIEAQEVGKFATVPDGNYLAYLKNGSLEMAKASGRPQISWTIEIAEGEQEGKVLMKFDGLDNELSKSWAKGTLNMLGIECKPSTLVASLKQFFEENDKRLINITVKTQDQYTNIYFNGYAEPAGLKAKTSKTDMKKIKFQIEKMNMKEIRKFIQEKDLPLDPDDYDSLTSLQAAVLEEIE